MQRRPPTTPAPPQCLVAIKGGHIVDARTLAEHAKVIGNSDVKIADGFHIASLSSAEYDDVMLLLNHSCEPNVGVGGKHRCHARYRRGRGADDRLRHD